MIVLGRVELPEGGDFRDNGCSPEIFRAQYDFAMSTPVPSYSVNALMAPPSTPLHRRTQREGRLVTDVPGPVTPWWTNLQPRQMTRQQLQDGIRWLVNRLYRPVAFEARMIGKAETRMGPRCGFEAELTIDRNDFGVTTYPDALGNEVKLVMFVEGVKG